MNSIESLERRHDESIFKGKVNEAISSMLDCMLNQKDRCCKKCNDVSVCIFLTEAVFAYRNRRTVKSSV